MILKITPIKQIILNSQFRQKKETRTGKTKRNYVQNPCGLLFLDSIYHNVGFQPLVSTSSGILPVDGANSNLEWTLSCTAKSKKATQETNLYE
ncbi:MAG: hypothetical protein LBN93_02265 [Candidatus Symbiothrix sp.]|jgi:hypothetical protein|nr:hypothetical protein [Candidatus Symbiothrix sp.]